jgi:uncharacterized protein (TIGR00299 family) protein
MRIAYLDCFSGISGDMFLGAAVEAGVPLEKLQNAAAALGVDATLAARRTTRGGLSATKIDVLIGGRTEAPKEAPSEAQHAHTHAHDHGHGHEHSHEHGHSHQRHADEHAHHVHRGLKEIRQILAVAPISSTARAFALRAFELLAAAEGKVHDRDPEEIHFHEVGSEDAIVDIVCAAVAVEEIAAERWYCSSLNVGSGTVQCAHGVMPVPAPATAELLRGAPVYSSGIAKELLTPTGAAILRALEVRFEPLPAMKLDATGYGAGTRDFAGSANVCRLLIGEEATAEIAASDDTDTSGEVVVLEANLDDMNPQIVGYVQQKLLDAGALDAFCVPVQMKKGRPGILLTVLAAPADAETRSRILLTETTTLGVRMRREQRRILARQHTLVQTPWGPVRVKLGMLGGAVVNSAPEFEDCRAIAEATGMPLKSVLQEAQRLYLEQAKASRIEPSSSTSPAGAKKVCS